MVFVLAVTAGYLVKKNGFTKTWNPALIQALGIWAVPLKYA
jgi:hypothetical protein